MAEQQLVDYITKARSAGQTDEQTQNLLYKNGWTKEEVGEAYLSLIKTNNQPQPLSQPQQQTNAPKDVSATIQAIDKLEAVSQPEMVVQQKSEPEIKPQATEMPVAEVQPLNVNKPQPEIQVKPEPEIEPKPQPEIQSQKIEPQQPMATMPSDMPMMRKKSHAILKTLIVLIILVVVGGAGYFVAGQYFNLPWSPFGPNPETVIGSMLKNMQEVKASHSDLQIEISAFDNASKASQGKLTLNTKSEMDATDVANIKSNGNFIVNLTVPGSTSAIVSFDVSTASLAGISYLKINNIVSPTATPYPGLNISQINGKWFEINQDSMKALSAIENGTAVVVTPQPTQTNNSNLIKKISDIIIAENIFTFDKKLNDEVISGQDTYHYSVILTKDKLKSLIAQMSALGIQEESKIQPQTGITDSSAALIKSVTQSLLGVVADSIGDVNIEMWIGKKDFMLYQYKIDKVADLNKALGTSISLELKATGISSNFNQSIVVKAPEGAQKIEEVAGPILNTQKISSNLNQIGSDAQSLFNASKSYATLCTRGLVNGYLADYGTDLVAMHTDIVNRGAKKPVCLSDANSYCISTQLVDGSYLCIDGTGATGTTKCVSALTVCK